MSVGLVLPPGACSELPVVVPVFPPGLVPPEVPVLPSGLLPPVEVPLLSLGLVLPPGPALSVWFILGLPAASVA